MVIWYFYAQKYIFKIQIMDDTLQEPKTLTNKETVDGKVEFLSSYMVIEDKESIPVIAHVYVDEDTVGRLDLIVRHYYGTTNELDLFLKFNDIDDMFAVPIGKHILIPDRYSLLSACKFISTKTECSLDANIKRPVNSSMTAESVAQTRSKLQNRGVGFTVVAPGVLKF